MAWDVVISGGGFGGFYAARALERTMPPQSTRITLVNDVNFLLYTPFLPEAAAGMLEPRHVVTPLRDVLEQTHAPADRRRSARDPARRTVTMLDQEGAEHELRYDRLVVAHGSVSRVLPIPGLDEHAIGFKTLADAIWLRNHVIQCLEMADATDDPEPGEELLTFVFVGGGYAGLEALAELQDFAAEAIELYPRGAPARDALDAGRGDGPRAAGDRRSLADYALRELRSRGIDIRLGTTLEEVTATSVRISDRRDASDAHGGVDRGRGPAPVRPQPRPAARRARADPRRRLPARAAARTTSGRSATAAAVPDPREPGQLCPPTSQHAIRQGKTAGRNVAASLGVGQPAPFSYKTLGQFVNLGRYKAVAKVFRSPSAASPRGGWRAPTT